MGDAMKLKKSAKKTKGVGKRASKDLAPRKSQDVKGSGLGNIASQIGNIVKTVGNSI
jgi:hypothetical protein